MVNTYTKGNTVERKCREVFQKDGWLTWKPSRAKYNSNDAFGLFDWIGLKSSEVLFAQVKSNPSHFYTSRKEIATWVMKNGLLITCLCILYEGNNEWRIEWFNIVENKWEKYHLTLT